MREASDDRGCMAAPGEVVFINRLEQSITTMSLNGEVVIRGGLLNNIEEVLAQAAVLACPLQDSAQTLDITMPLLERMASGLVAIGTRIGVISETIIEGADGYLVGPSAGHRLAEEKLEILTNPAGMRRIGEESLRLVKRFDVPKRTPVR